MENKKSDRLKIMGIIAAACLILASGEYIFGLLSSSVRLPTSGGITSVNLAVYWDSACTNPVTSIDWGTISPGGNKSLDVYIKNTGNIPITLSLAAENWSPSNAASYLTLTWDYVNGTVIQAGGVKKVTLTLTVSNSIQGITSFSFDIVITGTESQ